MNCKQGDLAIIVRSHIGNEGKLVEVIELLGINPRYKGSRFEAGVGPKWLVKALGQPIRTKDTRGKVHEWTECPFSDSAMRPIRPGELDDETENIRELEAV